MMVSALWKVGKLFYQGDSITTAALRWLAYKSLVRKMPHVHFEVLDLIGEKERVRHEAIVVGKEPL